MSDEIQKLQSHLQLLRNEYVKLQKKTIDLENKLQNVDNVSNQNYFVTKLLRFICELHKKPSYSDLKIKIKEQEICGHSFVFYARSENWGIKESSDANLVLDLLDFSEDVALALVQWVYTGKCEIIYDSDEDFVMNLARGANKFCLLSLKSSCEQNLISRVTSDNCIKYYQVADEVSADNLEKHCFHIMSTYWDSFTKDDFTSLPAETAYKIFKLKSIHPLHVAIRMNREDVVFLFMIEFHSQLPGKLNEMDEHGDFALDLALKDHHDGIATALVDHQVDVNRPDEHGRTLLHKAISRGDDFSARFLIENNCNVNASAKISQETPLHVAASHSSHSVEESDGICRIAGLLIKNGCNLNAQDSTKCTALHRAIKCNNVGMFSILLKQMSLNLNLQDDDGHTPLWLALSSIDPTTNSNDVESDDGYVVNSFASQLVSKGCSVNSSNEETGSTMLHEAALEGNQTAGLFLISHGADVNICNLQGESPLHIACRLRLLRLVQALLDHMADANVQAVPALGCAINPFAPHSFNGQTPLHVAAQNGFGDVVESILNAYETSGRYLNLELEDSQQDTALGVALWNGHFEVAKILVSHGADANRTKSNGFSLLHEAIGKHDIKSALFLLDFKIDLDAESPSGLSVLEMAMEENLLEVVEKLCSKDVDVNVTDKANDCILWRAMDAQKFEIAKILVENRCDVNHWSIGPGGWQQTMLHRAIDENKEDIACFLVKSKCDINTSRRPGFNGDESEEGRDGQGPIHLSANWGLLKLMLSLIEEDVDINAKDTEGDTALHIALKNQHHDIISLLLSVPGINLSIRNKRNQTPFSLAMTTRNNKAAYAILDRSPNAAEQLDNKGRSFLHIAIESKDLESVLFLIGVGVNANFRVQDSSQRTPLHMAVVVGNEMIIRNLLLAGASVNDATSQKQNALHLASIHDWPLLVSILIENKIDCNAVDDSMNNALHLACQHGHFNMIRVLLTQSNINIIALNMKGQNPLHVLGHYGKENAAAIFELFMDCFPQYPIDQLDINGNSVLMLAYFNGNSSLCKSLVKYGAKIGTTNKEGVSIFNAPVPTKQLLFKLLDTLSKEPPWTEGDNCLQCDVRFSLTTRKHHCRHCGRLLCARCSVKDIPIIKFGLSKPARVCDICFDILTLSME